MILSEEFIREFRQSEIIFQKGSPGTEMFVICSGEVQITTSCNQNEESAKPNILKVGDFFGEMALIDNLPRSATAIANTPGTRIAILDKSRFLYLVGQQPAFALTIMQTLSKRLRDNESNSEQ